MALYISRGIVGSLGLLLLAGTAFAQTTPAAKTSDPQPATTSRPAAAPTDATTTPAATDTAAAAARGKRFAEAMRQRFKNADTDHDGFLTRDEANKGVPMVARHFDEIDSKHTGKVSLDDVAAYLGRPHPPAKAPTPPMPAPSDKSKTQATPSH